MKVLLVDDEVGIREGLAAFLRIKGHTVRTAGTCAEALDLLAAEEFDCVVSDWHLQDGAANPILEACTCPVLAVSGYPEEVGYAANLAKVLHKPVPPRDVLAEIEGLAAAATGEAPAPGPVRSTGLGDLPEDTRCRLQAAAALAGVPCEALQVRDDGTFVTATLPLGGLGPRERELLEAMGGDLRTPAPGAPELCWRLHRDGRPTVQTTAVEPDGPWPECEPLAVDLDRHPLDPVAFVELLDRIAERGPSAGPVHLTNVPGPLRLLAEALGRGAELPMRGQAGPRIPHVLAELWS